MEGVIKADVSLESGEARVTMADGAEFDRDGAALALEKDLFELKNCSKLPATN